MTGDFQTLQLERRGRAMWLFLDRPAALNAIDAVAAAELPVALERAVAARPAAIVLSGRGDAFCAGADLKTLGSAIADGGVEAAVRALFAGTLRFFDVLENAPVPTIAAVNGVCVAGGFELLLAVDLAVAAEHARLGDGHANYGLLPAGGGSVRLPRLVGPRRAKQLLYTGELVSAHEAQALGLVNRVTPADRLAAVVQDLVETIAAKSRGGLRRLKESVNAAQSLALADGLELERRLFFEQLASPDAVEGLAAFRAKRAPAFD